MEMNSSREETMNCDGRLRVTSAVATIVIYGRDNMMNCGESSMMEVTIDDNTKNEDELSMISG